MFGGPVWLQKRTDMMQNNTSENYQMEVFLEVIQFFADEDFLERRLCKSLKFFFSKLLCCF